MRTDGLYSILIILLILTMTAAVAAQAGNETTVHGFVDASYLYNNNAATGEFGLDQVELDVMHAASEKTSLRADLEWVKNGNAFDVQVDRIVAAGPGKRAVARGRGAGPVVLRPVAGDVDDEGVARHGGGHSAHDRGHRIPGRRSRPDAG